MSTKILALILVLVIAAGAVFLVPKIGIFEENAPKIAIAGANAGTIYWNPKTPLNIQISDESGIASITGTFGDDKSSSQIAIEDTKGQKDINFELKLPKNIKYKSGNEFALNISANDTSYANFFSGNKHDFNAKIIIDTKAPDVMVLNQSYKVIKGGVGAAVFRVSDTSGALKELYVETNYGKRFKPTPFYKDGYWAVMVAWPSKEDSFNAKVVATDLAGNTTKSQIRYYLQDKAYKQSKINLTDAFINGKITELTQMHADNPSNMDAIAKFKFVNETLRWQNEEKIAQITANVSESMINDFFIKPFYPLKNGAAVASFGDHRFFMLDGSELSQSWHLGLDFASTAAANIVSSNDGVVVFAEENGIYGHNLIIYHGFGLYSLYGHCSTINVNVGDNVKAGDVVATTGITGLALGDHLHFGIVLQGVEVRPEEWMDKKWMKESVYDVLNDSKKIIDGTRK